MIRLGMCYHSPQKLNEQKQKHSFKDPYFEFQNGFPQTPLNF